MRCIREQEPLPAEEVNLFPEEKPKEDILFLAFVDPHEGHSGLSSDLIIRVSNSFLHLLQINS